MKKSVFVFVLATLSTSVTASVGGGLAGFTSQIFMYWSTSSDQLNMQRLDEAIRKEDVDALEAVLSKIPKSDVQQKVNDILQHERISLVGDGLVNPSTLVCLFLQRCIKNDQNDPRRLACYTTLFKQVYGGDKPVPRNGDCVNCDACIERPLFRGLVRYAAFWSNVKALEFLVDTCGASVCAYDHDSNERNTPLHAAVSWEYDPCVKHKERIACLDFLLKHNEADPYVYNRDQETTLDVAIKNGLWREVAYLLHHPGVGNLCRFGKEALWNKAVVAPIMFQPDRLAMLRVLRACNFPISQAAFSKILEPTRCVDGYRVRFVKLVHKIIRDQHSDFRVTAEHLFQVSLDTYPQLYAYVRGHLSEDELVRYNNMERARLQEAWRPLTPPRNNNDNADSSDSD